MRNLNPEVLLVISDPGLAGALHGALLQRRFDLRVNTAASLAQAHTAIGRVRPAVAVLDDATLGPRPLPAAVGELARLVPLVLLLRWDRCEEIRPLGDLLTAGRVQVIGCAGDFLPLAVMAVERKIFADSLRSPADRAFYDSLLVGEAPEDFGEILRHELNNPLTGILGNAELLLAQRNALPLPATQRLQTIAELAMRLRETVRRLSNAWQSRLQPLRSA